jgi:hypothetical protein
VHHSHGCGSAQWRLQTENACFANSHGRLLDFQPFAEASILRFREVLVVAMWAADWGSLIENARFPLAETFIF